MAFLSLLQQLRSQNNAIRLWAKKANKHLFNSSTSIRKNRMLVSETYGNYTESYTLWGHTYLHSRPYKGVPPEWKRAKKNNYVQNVCAPDAFHEQVKQRSPCSLLQKYRQIALMSYYCASQLRIRPFTDKTLTGRALLVCETACNLSLVLRLPFIFLAATAILCSPRLSDVRMIPDSLFCRSRDWATINAT